MNYVKNGKLRLSEIPTSLEAGGGDFSHSFDGYEFAGSFKACAEISVIVQAAIKNNDTKELTLSELRTWLFFYFRSLRHGGEPDKKRVDELLTLIRDRVARNKRE